MKSELEKELGKILSGIVRYEGGFVRAADGISDVRFQGSFSATGLIGLFGFSKRTKAFRVPKKSAQAVNEAFYKLGTPVALENAPDAKAVMCPSYIFNPAILTLEASGKNSTVTCYAYKGLLNGLNFKRQLKRLKRKAGDVKITEIKDKAD